MLYSRDIYVNRALAFKDQKLVKVITGIRRCGKSSLLQLIERRIKKDAPKGTAFITLHLDLEGCPVKTGDELYAYIQKHAAKKAKSYLFLDEIQIIDGWHYVVNSLREELDCDIYLTGSNAYLLSSDLATYLSGRSVEIPLLPLAFSEYCEFCGLKKSGGEVFSAQDKAYTFEEIFARYLTLGGMPEIANLDTTQEMQTLYWKSLYQTVVEKDIVSRLRKTPDGLRDKTLLLDVCRYVANTVGHVLSSTKLANALPGSGANNHVTVQRYLASLEAAYVIYKCLRYDARGKEILTKLPKYYMVDLGLVNYLDGYRLENSGFHLENAVYLQLLYGGEHVQVGKVGDKEIDFIAQNNGRTRYIQVCEQLGDERVRERELSALRALNNSHEKLVLARFGVPGGEIYTDDGIRLVSAARFFC